MGGHILQRNPFQAHKMSLYSTAMPQMLVASSGYHLSLSFSEWKALSVFPSKPMVCSQSPPGKCSLLCISYIENPAQNSRTTTFVLAEWGDPFPLPREGPLRLSLKSSQVKTLLQVLLNHSLVNCIWSARDTTCFCKVLGTQWSTKLAHMVLTLMEAIWTEREEISKETKKIRKWKRQWEEGRGKAEWDRVAGEGPSKNVNPEAQEEGQQEGWRGSGIYTRNWCKDGGPESRQEHRKLSSHKRSHKSHNEKCEEGLVYWVEMKTRVSRWMQDTRKKQKKLR